MIFPVSAEQICLRRRPAFWQQPRGYRGRFFFQVSQYLFDHHRVFDAGDNLNDATAFNARLDIDIEDALEASPQGAYFWCAHVIEARRSAEV